MSDDGTSRQPLQNPFNQAGVAKASQSPGELSTVETAATHTAQARLAAYIAAARAPAAGELAELGNVLAITGDYGSGKTHLAMLLLNHAGLENLERMRVGRPADIGCVYLEAADSFRGSYLTFIERLLRQDVYARVREYYADVVTTLLGQTEIAARAGELLRAGGTDPAEVTATLGLPESRLLDSVRARLRSVTNNETFARALTLLLRPGFEDAVWEWLRGGDPRELLVERGITGAIHDEQTALDAFGVFALLYRHQRRPFVLIVDEMTKLLPHDRQEPAAAELFRRFFEVFSSADALLVLVGLAEPFDMLSEPVRQRIGEFVPVPPFTTAQTRDLVVKRLASVAEPGDERDPLWPFTVNSLEELVRLTGGNVRKIVMYCHNLYTATMIDKSRTPPVTAAMVRHEAKASIGPRLKGHIRFLVEEVVRTLGWAYDLDEVISTTPESKVDLWIPVDAGSGCAVVISEIVADAESLGRLEAIAAAVRTSENLRVLPILVVGEPLGPAYCRRLRDAFGREPLIYREQSFLRDVATALKAMRQGLEPTGGGDTDLALREQVARLADRQARSQETMERVSSEVRSLHSLAERGFGVVRRELDEAVRLAAAFADRGGGGAEGPLPALPRRVRQLFDERIATLTNLTAKGSGTDSWDSLFAGNVDPAARRARLAPLSALLRPPNHAIQQALGTATMLRSAADAFRRGVNDWFRRSVPGTGGRLHPRDREDLESLCQAYDNALTILPMQSLDGFAGTGDAAQRRQTSEQIYTVSRQFEELGVAVRHAVLSAFPA